MRLESKVLRRQSMPIIGNKSTIPTILLANANPTFISTKFIGHLFDI